jgi:phosphoglucomutase
LGENNLGDDFIVEIIDPVNDYVNLLKTIFDFDSIRGMFSKYPSMTVLFDAMHGVTGPYAERLFVNELKLPPSSVMNAIPLPDFGGGHPDPNLTYAKDLVRRTKETYIDFAAASDGDGDRNMILSSDAFVNPSDSVAVIAAWSHEIPYFQSNGVTGVARSMPTSGALDAVAQSNNWKCFEVPTGWKFFGNLMDASMCSICGEESFGTGGNHIREKDGLWAIMAWLNILAVAGKTMDSSAKPSIARILSSHWKKFGRHYFSRYDYEDVDDKGAREMMERLRGLISKVKGTKFSSKLGIVSEAGDFEYKDPVDGSVSTGQGLYLKLEDRSRAIVRLSGTGSSGATVRVYFERYEANLVDLDPQVALNDLIEEFLQFSQIREYTKMNVPTVIT